VADINHDGYPDLLSLDMLPEDERVLKSSVGDEDISISNLRRQYGYHRQFSRNMLQLNNGGKNFREIALLSGVAATDWSWSALFGDYNQDGEVDLFISNGIVKRPNDLDYIKYVSNNQVKKDKQSSKFIDTKALQMMPDGQVENYFFQGSKDLFFRDRSKDWVQDKKSLSNGSAYADLDNDGDLDIVTNNINNYSFIYENKSNRSSYLKLNFKYKNSNLLGIGTKVYSWKEGELQYQQLFTTKGFQSSSEPALYFAYPDNGSIDSLKIVWPDQTSELMYEVATGQNLTISPGSGEVISSAKKSGKYSSSIFELIDSIPGLNYTHSENRYNDFDRQKLIPYRISDSGPAAAVGDLNNDGLEDIFIGNSRGYLAEIYYQTKSGFEKADHQFLQETRTLEITDAIIADFNGDGQNDIFYVTGGGEFSGEYDVLKDALWIYKNGNFEKANLPEYYSSAGVLSVSDFDKDGDLDIFIGGRAIAGDFGKIPESFLLKNSENGFDIVKLGRLGMLTGAIWDDIDRDGTIDLMVVGEWMAPKILKNTKGNLNISENDALRSNSGLWQSIAVYDLDNDGYNDYILGNWGLNSKFSASKDHPLKMYYGDIDNNGSTETILAKEKNGRYYTLKGLDELVTQMNFLRKDFIDYDKFACKPIEEIFSEKFLSRAEILEVNNLESGYLKNEKGQLKFVPFNKNLQFAPIRALNSDLSKNEAEKLLVMAGNYFGVTPYHGAFGAFSGAVLNEKGIILDQTGLDLTGEAVADMEVISLGEENYLLVFINNDKLKVYKINL